MKPILLTLRAEMYKGFWLLWNYRFNSLTELLIMGFVFIGASFFLGRGQFDSTEVSSMLLGYVVWYFAMTAISNMSHNLMEEARTGTLEQMFMSPVPMAVILLGRVFAVLVTATAQIGLMALVVAILMKLQIPMRLAGVPILLLTIMGLLGFGFVVGGLTLIYKQVYAIANLLQNIFVFLTGALMPVSLFPDWLQFVSKLLPSTQGIIVLRNVVLDGQSLLSTWNDGSLILLIANSSVYFVGGLLFFTFCENIAKSQGTLGQY